MKKKILITGGAYTDIPLIKAAKELGFYVVTTGNRENDMGHQYSDEYRKVDYSDKKALLNLALDLKIGAICPCASDFSALSCAYVARKLRLAGHDSLEVSEILHKKDRFRKFAAEHGIPSPKVYELGDSLASFEPERLIFPVIIKPVDQQAGRGVLRVNTISAVNHALQNAQLASRSKGVVIEEFIEGTNHGMSTFIKDRKIIFYFCDNEHYFLNRYMVSGASTPSSVPGEVIDFLIKQLEKIASILQLKDGILHIQFILREKIPYIIDICRRQPGDLYIDFIKHATGVDYPSYIIKAFAGMDISDLRQVEPKGFFTRHCIMADRPGKIKDIIFDKSIEKNIVDQFTWWKRGNEITDVLMQRFGIVFLKYESLDEMSKKTKKLHELIKVDV